MFDATEDLLNKSIKKLRDSFKDGFSRGDFFDRIKEIDEAMKAWLDVDSYSDKKIKMLNSLFYAFFPKWTTHATFLGYFSLFFVHFSSLR